MRVPSGGLLHGRVGCEDPPHKGPSMFATALLAASLAAPVPKSLKAKAASLDGRWEIVELVAVGQDLTQLNPWVWEISGESLFQYVRQRDGTLKLTDPGYTRTLVRPADGGEGAIDYTTTGRTTVACHRAMAAVEGDELVVCYANHHTLARPEGLKAGPDVHYCRFKRVKDDAKK